MPKSNTKTAVITGASSGIGSAIALKFAKNGYDLLLLGRNEARLNLVAADCRFVKTETLCFDLAHTPQYKSQILAKFELLTQPTVLVNNAGVYKTGGVLETDDEVWQNQFQINLLSSVQMTKILWPIFQKNNLGSIVNISSTLGLKPTASTGAYSAIKAAMINWTQSLAQEGGAFNIRANCICPGIVDTPIHSFHTLDKEKKNQITTQMSKLQLLDFIGQPEDVAEAAYFLASDLSRWTTGSTLSVDGGITIK